MLFITMRGAGSVIFWLLLYSLFCISEGYLEPDRDREINVTIEAAFQVIYRTVNRSGVVGDLYPYLDDIDFYVGNHLNKYTFSRSRYYRFTQCYHINIPGNSDWEEGYKYNLEMFHNLRHIRRLFDKIEIIRELIQDCEDAQTEAKATWLSEPTNETINRCIYKRDEILAYFNSSRFEMDVKFGQLDAQNVFIQTFYYSLFYLEHNGQPQNDTLGFQMAPIWKMLYETTKLDLYISRGMDILEQKHAAAPPGDTYWAKAVKDMDEHFVSKEDYSILHSRYRPITIPRRTKMVQELSDEGKQVMTGWHSFYLSSRANYSKFNKDIFQKFKNDTFDFYVKNFHQIQENAKLYDPPHLWEWKPGKGNKNAEMSHMNLAWDKMDEVWARLECWLKTDYLLNRDQILDNTQNDFSTTTELFNDYSYTLGQPCQILPLHDGTSPIPPYYDIVGRCTRENNEICAPRPLSQFEDPDDIYRGGFSVLKPKWVFKISEKGDKKCIGYKTWVIQQYACRCGFRKDCGDDLKVKISCPLQPIDWNERRQCRGSVGYPCKTLAMAVGKHNESCVTEYCDMEENSCEDKPFYIPRSGTVASQYGTSSSTFMIILIMKMIF